jgi:hypothetical protein
MVKIYDDNMQAIIEQLYERRLTSCSVIDAHRDTHKRIHEKKHCFKGTNPMLWGDIIAKGNWR